jgi:hypothetical protein
MSNVDAGTSTELTPESAAEILSRTLLSDEPEDQQDSETPPAQETPEPEPADAEAAAEQPEAEGEIPETEEPAEPEEPSQTFRVKVNGEEQEIPLDELLKGYSRTADYTRKTQEVAERRKAFEAEEASVRAEREKIAVSLKQLEQVLTETEPAEPDWTKLQQELPAAEFAAQYAIWDQHLKRKAVIRQEREYAERAVLEDRAKEYQKHLEGEKAKLVEAIPEWKDAAVAKAERSKLVSFLESNGYTQQDYDRLVDHRLVVVLRKAMLHDEALAKKPALTQRIEKVKAATPGPSGAQRPKAATEVSRAKERLAKTGNVNDAAALLELMGQ